MKFLFLVVLNLLLLESCTKEVKIDIPGFEEKLVVDGTISVDEPPIVLLSTSKDIYSATNKDAFLAGFVSGAIITVSDGINTIQLDEICSDALPAGTENLAAQLFGVPVSELTKNHLCAYTSFNTAIWGVVGKTYTLSISVNGKTYTSSTKIEQPTQLDKTFWVPDLTYSDYGFSWARLSDKIGQKDHYMWEVKRINKGSQGQPIDFFFTKTFLPVFNDVFIDGLSFDFFFENPMSFEDSIESKYQGFYKVGDTVVIKFSKMDQPVYNYFEKKYAQITTAGNPFATPTNIPSNITGGALGVWAGFSPTYDTLICKP